MVQEPYVNHIPTLMGGIGRAELTEFYTHHFIWQNPPSTELELISRTVGIDRVIDEFILKMTHDSQVDWLVPGVPATGRQIEVPMTGVVNIRGDRLYHEHIAWDQATVLVQLGVMGVSVPYGDGKGKELRLPVAGRECVEKMREKESVPSNEMLEFGVMEVGK
jgi:carboxymethylenebutenolidase